MSTAVDPPVLKGRPSIEKDSPAGSPMVAVELATCTSVGRSKAGQVPIAVRACSDLHTVTAVQSEASDKKGSRSVGACFCLHTASVVEGATIVRRVPMSVGACFGPHTATAVEGEAWAGQVPMPVEACSDLQTAIDVVGEATA